MKNDCTARGWGIVPGVVEERVAEDRQDGALAHARVIERPGVLDLGFRSHCRFRNRGTEYVSTSGMKWMSGGTKRQCDRALT
jgi:hypothetical protein